MLNPREDLFTVTASTALGMAQNLMSNLDAIIESLPEPELRMIREVMRRSLTTADHLLFSLSLTSDFEMLTVSEGMYGFQLSVIRVYPPSSVH